MLARLRPGADIFGTGRYGDAANYFESLRRAALAAREDDLASRATGNVGGCQFALRQYQPALRSFLEAHRLADQAGDASYAAVLDVNIASLYSEMENWKPRRNGSKAPWNAWPARTGAITCPSC